MLLALLLAAIYVNGVTLGIVTVKCRYGKLQPFL